MKTITTILEGFDKDFVFFNKEDDRDEIYENDPDLIKHFISSNIKELLENIEKLIVEEISIAQKEGQPTSRLTSLAVKINLLKQ